MLIVNDIWEEAQKIFGHCDEPKLFNQISDSIELLANKGEVDPLIGYVDLCVTGQCVTLPREVETPLAANIGGRPALGHDALFSFHLNGPGDFNRTCDFSWFDVGNFPTYRDLACPAKLIAFIDSEEDAGVELWVFGFDNENRPLRTEVNGVWRDGLLVPTVFGYALPDANAQTVSRISGVVKGRSVANIRLSSFDNSTSTGTLLGVYEPDETIPQYRRIRLARACSWVRLHYRRRTARVYSVNDRILLHSRLALLLAMRAVKFYDDADLPNGNAYEANATRVLTEKESVLTGVTGNPLQVIDRNCSISDKKDYLD